MTDASTDNAEPPSDCILCPRLAGFREEQQRAHPGWFNAPVPSFGDPAAWLAVIGLAPGLTGANRTGRPFTGDHAGGLLFKTLGKVGLARGEYDGRADDGLSLQGAIIINAVRCLPPQNKPTTGEIHNCRQFLVAALNRLPRLKTIIALGTVAHGSIVRAYGEKPAHYKFVHGAQHRMPDGPLLIDSYHCSRYNQNTGRLTDAMFAAIFEQAVSQHCEQV
ncbi:uracil-DNA glycosylase [Parasphingopyxis lamellibrachiae]|uniref:Type-5 uracil-DNA glycosylase n=1 Tax=Parasphingopyxis lamellibrachiae TaxID=680125 RepID=A0A3D9FBU5_9SPHN|nr:uracil-DNA glycosylase [Parasphingopyxis lamellibrachiae]RED15284.1 uracil-DNA glycosylase family 4 [Parasphingopyxis lamellibrachiae]